MKRVILLFAAVLLASIGWSQTVTLKFKNGTTQQYSMSELESIDFIDGNNENSDDSNNGYIQVKIDGKTYKESILYWAYAQIDPLGNDAQGNKLTYTYDMTAHFEDTEGFLFMFGLSHFRNKSALLESNPGSYPFAKDIYDDAAYNNLAFTCLYELDGDEYNTVSGTHQVKSIKSIGSDVYVEGSFTAVFSLRGDTRNISGSYRMLIP